MQQSKRLHGQRILTFTLLVGFLGFQVGSLLQPAATSSTRAPDCEAPSELHRLACISSTPSDARPLPPQA